MARQRTLDDVHWRCGPLLRTRAKHDKTVLGSQELERFRWHGVRFEQSGAGRGIRASESRLERRRVDDMTFLQVIGSIVDREPRVPRGKSSSLLSETSSSNSLHTIVLLDNCLLVPARSTKCNDQRELNRRRGCRANLIHSRCSGASYSKYILLCSPRCFTCHNRSKVHTSR